MQAYFTKLTYTPYYVEMCTSSTPILRGFEQKKSSSTSGFYSKDRHDFALRRAKKRLRFLISANVSHKDNLAFWSFTFSPKFDHIAKNEVSSRRYFSAFIKRLKRKYNLDIKYVAIAEKQKKNNRNAWHFHVLFFNLPYFPHDQMQDVWSAGFVFVTSRQNGINDVKHIISYMSKYLTKSADIARHKKLFWGSRNLEKPQILYDPQHFDFSQYILYSDINVVALDSTAFTIKTYFHNYAIANKSSTAVTRRTVHI